MFDGGRKAEGGQWGDAIRRGNSLTLLASLDSTYAVLRLAGVCRTGNAEAFRGGCRGETRKYEERLLSEINILRADSARLLPRVQLFRGGSRYGAAPRYPQTERGRPLRWILAQLGITSCVYYDELEKSEAESNRPRRGAPVSPCASA